jgi:hypothetical protein
MRYLIYFIGILIAVFFFTQAHSAYEHRTALVDSNKSISSEFDSLNKSLAWLNGFQKRQPQTILNSYQDFLNNVHLITNANQASVLVRAKDVSTDKNDINLLVKESPYSGINQIDLEITVEDLTNSNKLAAIFDAFSGLENRTPIIIHGFYQEKDYLVFNVSVLGV